MKTVLKIVVAVLAAIILLAACVFVIPVFEHGDITPVAGSSDWMNGLDDSLPLNEITLPGSHDCATQYVQLAFFSKCQSSTILEQLEMGYRYLDIRLGIDGEKMPLMHGFTYCKSALFGDKLCVDDVLSQCYQFLENHPTETVIFAVKQEHGDESVNEFETMLNNYISAHSEMWYFGDNPPTLGEARGKLVLLRRYDDAAQLGTISGLDIEWVNQPGNENTALNIELTETTDAKLYVQDRYEYDTTDKWTAFTTGIKRTDELQGDNNICINFLSTKGTLAYGHPYFFAAKLNKMLLEENFGDIAFAGWIITDFSSAELAEKIYSIN